MRFTCLLVPMFLILGGCFTQSPRIGVESVQVVARNQNAMAIQFNMELSNPNDKPIEPLELNYAVSVLGKGVYQGRHAAEMTLDARGNNRPLSLPAVIRFDQMGWSEDRIPEEARWRLSGTLVYMNQGVFSQTLLDFGYRPSTGFSASGVLETTVVLDPEAAESSQSSLPVESAGS
ncbi:MAG: hypothetical protein MK089_03150 [Phycisphaerales bacterium]|nr:hypothetical protein [Phycisphaerales bacterium]